MKFNLKTLVAAVALAAAAGSASAAIDFGALGNGELFFSAWDGATSYNYDMNVTIDGFEAAVATAGKVDLQWKSDFTSSYGSWLSTASTSGLQWAVLATDTMGQRRMLATAGGTLPALNKGSDVLRTGAANIQGYINIINPQLTGNSVVTTSNISDAYFGKYLGNYVNDKFNFNIAATFANNSYANGVTFEKTLANATGIAKGTNTAYFDEGVAVRAYVDGNNVLHIGAVAAVPEPSEYALLLAGLGVIGAIVRRRAQKQA